MHRQQFGVGASNEANVPRRFILAMIRPERMKKNRFDLVQQPSQEGRS